MNNKPVFLGHTSSVKYAIFLMLLAWSVTLISQEKLEIDGKVKITTMDASESDSIVVWNSDRTLGVRQSSALNKIILNALANKNETFTSDSTGTVMDKDGHIYATVKIGSQWWMAENLRTTKYSDGSTITYAESNAAWDALTAGGYSFYDTTGTEYSAYSRETFGALYNWYAVDDSRGLCPSGWHVASDNLPSDSEWQTLMNYLGGDSAAGTKMKTTSGWQSGVNGTNMSGFSGLPGGARYSNGAFFNVGGYGYWWSSSQLSTSLAWYRGLLYDFGDVDRYYDYKELGFSVRCLRD